VSLERQGLFSQTLEIYQRAEQIDAAYAELNFRMADGYYRLGNYTKAEEYYIKARDNDTLRFRPSSALYQVIKQDYGIQSIDSSTQLVDIERSFAEASPEGIPGENLFYDHVHLNIDGHYLVASRIFDSIVHNGWLSNVSTTGTILGGTCSKTECLKRLGYTTTDEYKLLNKIIQVLSRPPFTNQLNHETHLRHLKLQYENYLQGRNKDSMEKTVADYKEALLLNLHNEGLRLRLASTYKQMGQYEEARDHYLKLLEMNPGKPQILHLLAKVYSTLGKSEKAIECYQEAIKHRPYNPVWYSDRGLVYFKKGDYDKAIADFSQALSIEPKYAIACNNRGSVYFKKGDYDKAIADFNRAVSIDPNYAAAYNNRGSVYFKKEDYDKAWEDFHQAQRLGHPVDPAVLKNRGRSP
jgi:tetratricopeptide (TPR) repeat protein